MSFFDLINQYAQVINFALLIAIIGWLFNLTKLSREAIEETTEAKLALKDTEIGKKDLELQFKSQAIADLKHNQDVEKKRFEELLKVQEANRLQIADLQKKASEFQIEAMDKKRELEFAKQRFSLLEQLFSLGQKEQPDMEKTRNLFEEQMRILDQQEKVATTEGERAKIRENKQQIADFLKRAVPYTTMAASLLINPQVQSAFKTWWNASEASEENP